MRNIFLTALIVFAAASPASARDTTLHLDIKDVLDASYSEGKLDGSVRFYFAGQPTPATISQIGDATTSKKTSAVGKNDATACKWAMLSALLALQEQAKSLGANAVVGIASNYDRRRYASATQYECHAGSIMAGVALKGSYVKLRN